MQTSYELIKILTLLNIFVFVEIFDVHSDLFVEQNIYLRYTFGISVQKKHFQFYV